MKNKMRKYMENTAWLTLSIPFKIRKQLVKIVFQKAILGEDKVGGGDEVSPTFPRPSLSMLTPLHNLLKYNMQPKAGEMFGFFCLFVFIVFILIFFKYS